MTFGSFRVNRKKTRIIQIRTSQILVKLCIPVDWDPTAPNLKF